MGLAMRDYIYVYMVPKVITFLIVIDISTMLVAFVLVSTLICLANSQPDFSCETPKDEPDLPSLEKRFRVEIEAFLTSRQRTILIEEYYDGPGQRGRINRRFSENEYSIIVDYKSDQSFHINWATSGASCRVESIENDRTVNLTFHTIKGPDGNISIGSVNDLLVFGGKYNETYMGVEVVKGVCCNRWQYKLDTPNNTFTLDYWFSVESWNFSSSLKEVPVQASVEGWIVDDHSPTGHNFSNYYSFSGFRSLDEQDESKFMVPEGIVCSNRKLGKKLPLLDEQYFSFSGEFNYNKTSFNFRIFYDKDTNLFRVDYRNLSANTTGVDNRVTVIHDFTSSVQYLITRQTGICKMSPLTANRSIDVDIDDHGHLVLKSLQSLLYLPSNASNFVYEGLTTERGIDAEAWITFIPMESGRQPNSTILNRTTLIYFTAPGWKVPFGTPGQQIPIHIHSKGIFKPNETAEFPFSVQSSLFDFDLSEPDYDVFDASLCFGPSNSTELMFTLPGVINGTNLASLRSYIRKALSKFTSAPLSQFGGIQVWFIKMFIMYTLTYFSQAVLRCKIRSIVCCLVSLYSHF